MKNVHSSHKKGLGWCASALMCLGILSLPAKAEDAAVEFAGDELWKQGGCSSCHGSLANGGGGGADPAGPSLRRKMDRDFLLEVISCGRPGTQMPMNLTGAYTETACYGLPLGSPPPVSTNANFTAEQIEILVDFLMEHAVGVRTITRENCAAFNGGNLEARACLQY